MYALNLNRVLEFFSRIWVVPRKNDFRPLQIFCEGFFNEKKVIILETKVISVFAGLGKTYVGKKYKNVCDLQSSPYRYDYSNVNSNDYERLKYTEEKNVNPEWPNNYVKAIKSAMENYEVVLVPSNEDVRTLLIENNIPFIFILPDLNSREILLERYKERNNNEKLIKEVMEYFDNWSREQKDYSYPIYILEKNKYLENLLINLKILKEES